MVNSFITAVIAAVFLLIATLILWNRRRIFRRALEAEQSQLPKALTGPSQVPLGWGNTVSNQEAYNQFQQQTQMAYGHQQGTPGSPGFIVSLVI
jgi:hypothetical protein